MLQRGRKSAASLATIPVSAPQLPPRNRQFPPPAHLSVEMQAWWSEVVAEVFFLEPHRARLLQLACESLDRVAEARAIIAAEGLTFNDRHGCPRVHPACIVERDNKIAAGRLIKELALDPPADKNPGGFGVTPSTLRRPWE
jgi:P27 family predicted phage terminase small subunit